MKPCGACDAREVCDGAPLAILADQPPDDQEWSIDGIFTKRMYLARSGMVVPQHSHAYEHLSMLTTGAVAVWKDGVYDRVYEAPAGIVIEANVKHMFKSLSDNTSLLCIHNTARTGAVEITSEHQLAGGV